MKEKELRERATCDVCGQKVLSKGLPLFYVVTVERYSVDLKALQRQAGLEMMLGNNVPIAQVMGPNEDMAERIGEQVKLSVCEGDCAYLGPNVLISLALEKASKAEETSPDSRQDDSG